MLVGVMKNLARLMSSLPAISLGISVAVSIAASSWAVESLPTVVCIAEQTGGFHDYPGGEEFLEPALFHPRTFSLEENLVFMMNLAADERNVDLYLTLQSEVPGVDEGAENQLEATELECRRVRGADDSYGYSCVNLPPSEMLLINAQSLRFTRTAVGGWTFTGAAEKQTGDSIFVEFGQCVEGKALDQ
jgi:hypothetical protein